MTEFKRIKKEEYCSVVPICNSKKCVKFMQLFEHGPKKYLGWICKIPKIEGKKKMKKKRKIAHDEAEGHMQKKRKIGQN